MRKGGWGNAFSVNVLAGSVPRYSIAMLGIWFVRGESISNAMGGRADIYLRELTSEDARRRNGVGGERLRS